MEDKSKRIDLMLSILSRGKGKAYISMLTQNKITYHLQSVGYGTASSDMMDIFGLLSKDKDIIFSLAQKSTVDDFATEYAKKIDTVERYGGIMLIMSLSAINRISAEIISRADKNEQENESEDAMSTEYKQYVIFITVNRGFSDEVMHTARKAGSTGGTVIKARFAGSEIFPGAEDAENVQDEKEIITILASANTCPQIMEAVNKEFGFFSKANGMVCSVPVERALKI